MSGSEEFGSGGYGTGDAERAAAETGPGGSARTAPPAGPRVHVPGEPNQGPAAGANGAPWLAAGSVPYAEAMFGVGQDGPQGRVQRAAGPGRRGAPDGPQQAQAPGGAGYPEGYGPEGYANGTNGYPPRPAPQQPQAPHVPQQRYDASPYDSGFTEQARFAAQQQNAPGGYEYGQQPAADRPGSAYEQERFPSGQYPAAPAPTGPTGAGHPGFDVFDEPTTEFMPGPLFDEPTVRTSATPPPAPPPGVGMNGRGSVFSSRQAPQPPANGVAPSAPAGTTQRPSMSGSGTWTAAPPAAQPAPQKPPHTAGPSSTPQPATGQQPGGVSQPPSQPSASVSGIPRVPSQHAAEAIGAQSAQSAAASVAASAASAVAAPPPPSPTPPPVGAARGEAPRRADSGYTNAPLPPRPALPDEPPPGPPPLPTRPPRAERQAQQAQAQPPAQPRTQTQAPAAPPQPAARPAQQAHAQAPAAPSQPAAPHQQPQPQQAPPRQNPPPQNSPQAQQQTVAAVQSTVLSPATAAVRETLTPPRRSPQPPPAASQSSAQIQTVQPPSGADDLTSERLRSVAPVPRPRTTTPERPARTGAFDALAEPPAPQEQDTDTDEGDELIVPWQAATAPPPVTESPENDEALRRSGPQQQPDPEPAPAAPSPATPQQPQPQQTPAPAPSAPAATQSPQVAAPTRTEATAATAAQVPPAQPPAPTPPAQPAPAQPPAAQPTAAQPQGQAQPPAQAQAPAPAAPVAPAAPAAGPASAPTAPNVPQTLPPDLPPNVPAPRGTRRRVPEGATEPDPRSYANATASPPDGGADESGAGVAESGAQQAAAIERAPAYDEDALAAVYRVIHERRDVRNDFLPDPVPTEVLTRILEAAHTAPSVGFSQPWDFLVIRDHAMRERVHELAVRQRRAYAASLPKARARAFAALKIEAILETPVNIVVTCDPTRGGRHTLGRYTQPLMAPFSSCLAVENLWLAARAEGLGVGWVSFFDERELAAVLDLPEHLQVVAYLCIGYVRSFPREPELAGAGWAQRRPLAWAVHEEHYGHRALPGAEPISLLSETVAAIRGLDVEALTAARDRQARMTKPPGSLGALEALCEQLAGLAGVCPPPLPEPAALAVFAADHGVHAQGVTPWPQEVTAQMVANFLAGGAVVNAFAKQVGAEVCVVDVGVAADLLAQTGLIPRKIRYGTADMTQGPALTREEATAAIEAGIETARDLVAAGNRCLLTGDMGIANTTASAALIAAFTGASPAQVTGYGTGIDEQTYAHKVEVVRTALELHRPDPHDPVGVLCAFGGLEHAALAGFILGAAALRVPVVLDGVIAGAAALVAQALSPEVTAACVAGHRSAEPGHALALEQLGITPLIDLELRLGEGSGAALALPLVGAAVRALREVATFDSAGVSDASAAVVPPTERERT